MTPADLKRARELCEAATPGPWRWSDWSAPFGTVETRELMHRLTGRDLRPPEPQLSIRGRYAGEHIMWVGEAMENEDDRAFIASARTLVPQLLDEVERLQAEVAVVKESRDSWEHRWRKTIGMAQEVQVEEETAERIAAWLEKRSPQSVPYQTTSIMTAGQIRAGAWRTEKP